MGNRIRALAIAALAVLPAGACAPRITAPPATAVEMGSSGANLVNAEGRYRVIPGDTLDVRYSFHAERNQREVVRPDGKIRAAGIGELPVAGFSTEEIAAVLTERSRERLRDPQVVVGIHQYAARSVYVAGEVGRPGPVPYRRGLTPLQAIAEAGGMKNTALAASVVLVRPTGSGGETLSRTLDLDQVMHQGAVEPLFLAPHDVVFVPKTGIAEANVWVDQHFTQIFPFFRGASASMSPMD